MKKLGFWRLALIGLKGYAVSLLSSLLLLFAWLIVIFLSPRTPVVAVILMIALLPISFAIWGWIANRLFKWR